MLLRSLQQASSAGSEGLLLLTCRCTALFNSNTQLTPTQQLHFKPQQQQQQQQLHSWPSSRVHFKQQQQQQQQHFPSLQCAWLRQEQLLSVSAARHFSSTRSSCAEYSPELDESVPQAPPRPKQELMHTQLQTVLKGMPGQLLKQPLFRNKLSSKIQSRKPAIKYPARHQWRYCAVDYDPMEAPPIDQGTVASPSRQMLPPYASLLAHTKDYNAILKQTMPKFHRNSYRRLFRKNVAIADQRWRAAWEKKLAVARRREDTVRRLSERIIRERSWQLWQVQQQYQQQQYQQKQAGMQQRG